MVSRRPHAAPRARTVLGGSLAGPACIIGTVNGSISRPLALAAVCAALAAGCATAPPPPPPPPPPVAPAPPPPPVLGVGERLDLAARLLADGTDLPRVRLLLDGVPPRSARRDQLLGQLAELSGDDAGAVEAYDRSLARMEDDDVRLRRALLLERMGRGDEVKADLERLRPPPPASRKKPERKLRPLQ